MSADPAVSAAALYAGIGGLILIWFAAAIISLRVRLKVSIGDGGQPRLARAMRGQANFVEYAPVMYVLLLAMALMGTPGWVVHLFGIAFTAGRLMHAAHFLAADAPGWQRSGGAFLTLNCVGLAGLGVVGHALYVLLGGGA